MLYSLDVESHFCLQIADLDPSDQKRRGEVYDEVEDEDEDEDKMMSGRSLSLTRGRRSLWDVIGGKPGGEIVAMGTCASIHCTQSN